MSSPADTSPLAPLLTQATLDQQRETQRSLQKPLSVKRLLRMTERALARADTIIAKTFEIVSPPAPVACQAGCPYCCHIRLTVSPPEILLVLEHIQAKWALGQIETLKKKVKNTDAFTRGLGDDARAQLRLPCPLLKDGSCSVHAVRPLSCRAVASVAVEACKRAYANRMQDGVPMFEPQYMAANGIGYGLYAGLAEAGYGVENVELVAALSLGLNDKQIAQKWLHKEPVFAPATWMRP